MSIKSKVRVCCDGKSVYKVVYDGGSVGNDTILICDHHITVFPFNLKILTCEAIER